MNILLTGSSGMVGRNILEHQNADDYKILNPTSAELNLLDVEAINHFLKTHKPDLIIHAAGLVGGIEANISNPAKFLIDNMLMGINILNASRNAGIQKFINIASSCMYPVNAKNPLSEEQILDGKLEPTNEGYALAKIAATKLCDYISNEDSSLKYKTVIPCNMYGKYDNFNPQSSHMIAAVIKKIHDAKSQKKESVDIWGDGKARREFMYAGDFADFIFYSIKNFEKMPNIMNVGIGHDYSVKDYYISISKSLNYEGSFNYEISKPIGMPQKLLDSSRVIKFGWTHTTDLNHGIQYTYEHFLNKNDR